MKFLFTPAATFVALLLAMAMALVSCQETTPKKPDPLRKEPVVNSSTGTSTSTTQSMLNRLLEDIDVEESRMKRGYGGGGGGHGHGPGRGGGAAGPIYFCGYVGSKEGYGGYGK